MDYMVGHQGYGALDMKFTNRLKEKDNFFLCPSSFLYFQAIGNKWKVLGGGRTNAWAFHATVLLGHH